jgi:hypothetical protein
MVSLSSQILRENQSVSLACGMVSQFLMLLVKSPYKIRLGTDFIRVRKQMHRRILPWLRSECRPLRIHFLRLQLSVDAIHSTLIAGQTTQTTHRKVLLYTPPQCDSKIKQVTKARPIRGGSTAEALVSSGGLPIFGPDHLRWSTKARAVRHRRNGWASSSRSGHRPLCHPPNIAQTSFGAAKYFAPSVHVRPSVHTPKQHTQHNRQRPVSCQCQRMMA